MGLAERAHGVCPNEAALQWRRQNLLDIFLNHPLGDQNVRSLVFEEKCGHVVGFLGLVPKPILFRREPISGAVGTYFLVDPANRGKLIGIQLLRAALAGQQDLLFGDAVSDVAKRLLSIAGAGVSTRLSYHWVRPLRPLALVLSKVKGPSAKRGLAKAAAAPAAILDRLSSRLPFIRVPRPTTDLSLREIDRDSLLICKSRLEPRKGIQPNSNIWLSWAIARMQASPSIFGCLRLLGSFDRTDRLVGWCVLCTKPGQIAEVLDFGATDKVAPHQFDLVTIEAFRAGATGLAGRIDPNLLGIVSNSYCFVRPNNWMMFHSRHPEIWDAFERDDVDLSRMDGEFIFGLP